MSFLVPAEFLRRNCGSWFRSEGGGFQRGSAGDTACRWPTSALSHEPVGVHERGATASGLAGVAGLVVAEPGCVALAADVEARRPAPPSAGEGGQIEAEAVEQLIGQSTKTRLARLRERRHRSRRLIKMLLGFSVFTESRRPIAPNRHGSVTPHGEFIPLERAPRAGAPVGSGRSACP